MSWMERCVETVNYFCWRWNEQPLKKDFFFLSLKSFIKKYILKRLSFILMRCRAELEELRQRQLHNLVSYLQVLKLFSRLTLFLRVVERMLSKDSMFCNKLNGMIPHDFCKLRCCLEHSKRWHTWVLSNTNKWQNKIQKRKMDEQNTEEKFHQ